MLGKNLTLSVRKQSLRCDLMLLCRQRCKHGSFPNASVVTTAKAKTPQSAPPRCCCSETAVTLSCEALLAYNEDICIYNSSEVFPVNIELCSKTFMSSVICETTQWRCPSLCIWKLPNVLLQTACSKI